MIPCHVVADDTMYEVHKVMKWSFDQMLNGTWPLLDHLDRPFGKNSYRFRNKGLPLCTSLPQLRGVYCTTVADWKWVKEAFALEHHYNAI